MQAKKCLSRIIDIPCSTPDEWLAMTPAVSVISNKSEVNRGTAALNLYQGTKWPSGIVKYILHESLTEVDKHEVHAAFDEYHKKTCIKFQKWNEDDPPDYISIEVDNRICGVGSMCKVGGYQFAKFGLTCRRKATMVHELGHNLCLGHENQRADRDYYISFRNCHLYGESSLILPNQLKEGIYDYSSIMHNPCNQCSGGWPKEKNVKGCGKQLSDGLSVMDADHINDLYQCQGKHIFLQHLYNKMICF